MKIFHTFLLVSLISISCVWSQPHEEPTTITVALPKPAAHDTSISIALDLVKKFEGFRSQTYWDMNQMAIGYGFSHYDIPTMQWGDTMTRKEADRRLYQILLRYRKIVKETVDAELNHNQLAALISLAYNIGPNAFKGSRVVKHLNAGNYGKAAKAISHWKYAKGVVLAGLRKRREAETKLFHS